jgi:hypothetical protein
MNRSESISKLAEALSAFQAQVDGAKKSSENPLYKSKYADLAEIWKTIREPLTANGLSVAQVGVDSESGTIAIETILLHTSGEWISGITKLDLVERTKNDGMKQRNDPQSAGAAITYARRYGLSAILGIHQEDDDANTFCNNDPKPSPNEFQKESRRYATLMATKQLTADDLMLYPELYENAVKAGDHVSLYQINDKLDRKPAKATQPTASDLRKSCADEIKRLIESGIDNYGDETRRHNSFVKHLGTDTLKECENVEKLTAYLDHLKSAKPTKSKAQITKELSDAKISAHGTIISMVPSEEREKWETAVNTATDPVAVKAVQDEIVKSFGGAE